MFSVWKNNGKVHVNTNTLRSIYDVFKRETFLFLTSTDTLFSLMGGNKKSFSIFVFQGTFMKCSADGPICHCTLVKCVFTAEGRTSLFWGAQFWEHTIWTCIGYGSSKAAIGQEENCMFRGPLEKLDTWVQFSPPLCLVVVLARSVMDMEKAEFDQMRREAHESACEKWNKVRINRCKA